MQKVPDGKDETQKKEQYIIMLVMFLCGANTSLTLVQSAYYDGELSQLYYPWLLTAFTLGRFLSYFVSKAMLARASMQIWMVVWLFMTAVLALVVGMETSLTILIIARLLGGSMAIIQDFANDLIHDYTGHSNEKRQSALKANSLCYTLGFVLTIFLSSGLAFPNQHGLTDNSFFDKQPFLIHCLWIAVLQIIGMLIVLFGLSDPASIQIPEDNYQEPKKRSRKSRDSTMMTFKKPQLEIQENRQEQEGDDPSLPESGPMTVRHDNEISQEDYGLDFSPYVQDDEEEGSDDDYGPDFSYLQPTALDSEQIFSSGIVQEHDAVNFSRLAGDEVEMALRQSVEELDKDNNEQQHKANQSSINEVKSKTQEEKRMSQSEALPRFELEDHLKRPTMLDKDVINYQPVRIALGITFVYNIWSFAIEESLMMWILLQISPNIVMFGVIYSMIHLATVFLSYLVFYEWQQLRASRLLLTWLFLLVVTTVLFVTLQSSEIDTLPIFFIILALAKINTTVLGATWVNIASDAVKITNILQLLSLVQQTTVFARLLAILIAASCILLKQPYMLFYLLLLMIPIGVWVYHLKQQFPRLENSNSTHIKLLK